MKNHFLLLLIIFTNAIVYAQLNESDTVKFQLRASLTGNYQKGNVEVLNIRGKLDFIFSPVKGLVFKSQNSTLYQEFYGKKADNDVFSRNYLYYKPQHKFYPFAIAYVSANFRRKIKSRYFAGTGITYQLLTTNNYVLKLSASAVYEQSVFNDTEFNYEVFNNSDKINVWRGTLYFGGWVYIFQKHLRIYYDAFWQPAFNSSINYRTQYDIGLDLPVWKGLSMVALYTFTHENVVNKNVQQEDGILSFGVAYNLRKK
jgi:Protein of unknown function, DUF481